MKSRFQNGLQRVLTVSLNIFKQTTMAHVITSLQINYFDLSGIHTLKNVNLHAILYGATF